MALGSLGLGRTARCVGFFTTRYVEADSEAAATQVVRRQVIDDLVKKKVTSVEQLNQLELRVDKVAVVAAGQRVGPNEGFTFFEE